MANGMTSLMGLWTEMRAHLEWMRQHNLTAPHPVGFYGIDLSGSNVSMLPGLGAVLAYLAQADPEFEVDPSILVEIHCDKANVRSQAVPRRLGYHLDRIEADDIKAPAEIGRSMVWIFP